MPNAGVRDSPVHSCLLARGMRPIVKASTITLAARYISLGRCSVQLCLDPLKSFLGCLSPLSFLLPPRYTLVPNMPRSKISLLLSLLLASHSTFAQRFTPRGDIEQRYGTRLEKRLTCEPARPDVSEDAVRLSAAGKIVPWFFGSLHAHRSSRMLAMRTHRIASPTASTHCTFSNWLSGNC